MVGFVPEPCQELVPTRRCLCCGGICCGHLAHGATNDTIVGGERQDSATGTDTRFVTTEVDVFCNKLCMRLQANVLRNLVVGDLARYTRKLSKISTSENGIVKACHR